MRVRDTEKERKGEIEKESRRRGRVRAVRSRRGGETRGSGTTTLRY